MSTAIRRSYARVPAYGHRRGLNRGARHGNMGGWRRCSNGRSCWPRSPRRQHVVAGSSSSAARQASGRPRSCARSSRSRRRGVLAGIMREPRDAHAARPVRGRRGEDGGRSGRVARRGSRRPSGRPRPPRRARPARGCRPRGRPLGRRGDAGRAAGARQADRRHARARGRDVPGRRGRHRPSAARGARRARLGTGCRAAVRATALPRRRPHARRGRPAPTAMPSTR